MTVSPRIAVDTSVAIPLLVASHPAHEAVTSWAANRSLAISGHALIETYAVLTRLPGDARVSPADAVRLIDDNFEETLVLAEERAKAVHRELAQLDIAGGAAYDGLVAMAVRDSSAELATRDARARSTYEAVGVSVRLIASGSSGSRDDEQAR